MSIIHMGLAVLVAALWGGNFVAAKVGVSYFPPFFFTSMRFICVTALLIPFVPRPSLDQLKRIMPVGLMATFHFSLLFVSLHRGLDISSGSLVGQLGVPFSCILGAIFFKDRIGVWHITGIVIAFIGIAVIAGAPNILAHPDAFFISIASALSWAIANIFVKRVKDIPSMQLLAWMSLFTLPILLLLSTLLEPVSWSLIPAAPLSSWLGLAYTTLASTLGAYGLWYFLLNRYTVSQVAPFSLLTPVFGISCGQIFFQELLTTEIIAGGIITIVGVAIIVLRKPKHALITEAT
ncbi:MAG: EamA family transporter [Rickettsiales bacterium]|nr:EamA family transporter [Rickettsiales bacterium]